MRWLNCFAWLLPLACLAGTANAQAGPATADCDALPAARILEASDGAPPQAGAAWLDAERLRWPGKSKAARWQLLGFAHAAPALVVGQRPPRADVALALVPDARPLSPAMSAAFAWLGDGDTLRVADADAPVVRDWLGRDLRLVALDGEGRVVDATRVQHAAALDVLYSGAQALDDFGATVANSDAHFRLWAPTASAVTLCLYPDASAPAEAALPMQRDADTGSWWLQRDGDLHGRYFTYLVDVFVPGEGTVRNRVTDPYAFSLSADGVRTYAARADHASLQPPGWAVAARGPALASPTDAVVYELHVRDFSASDASVPAPWRGKYLGFTVPKSDGMRHLRSLAAAGITDIHLLPVYDFASVPESGCTVPQAGADGPEAWQAAVMAGRDQDCFNWGYDPMHFGAPEGSYASDANDGAARVREFRAMVMALHEAGLRVGMDVVYNHTFASGQSPRSVLDRIVPGYYHRLDREGRVTQSTCCENTATEHPMMAKLMIDTAVRWVRDYRIDSFRFDLMGHQPRAAMLNLQQAVDAAAGKPVLLVGEGWNFGEVADGARFVQASQRNLGGSGIGTFSDRARDAVRGGGCCDSGEALVSQQGWANGLDYAPNALAPATADRERLQAAADLLRVGLAGSVGSLVMQDRSGQQVLLRDIDYVGQPAGYASGPADVVNYVENHDNLTLFDANALKLPAGTPSAERARVQLLALSTVALSQGIAYFHAGGEILRSKSLDRNSFNSGDAFNRLDWTLADNGFGIGLPPSADNAASWDAMRAVLADGSVKPSPQDIRWTRDVFLDLLRIRASTRLLRLRDAAALAQRLSFLDTGPAQTGSAVAVRLDGSGLQGAGFRELTYVINAGLAPVRLVSAAAVGKAYGLHPVQAGAQGADARVRDGARFDAATGEFTVPARTAAVFVVD